MANTARLVRRSTIPVPLVPSWDCNLHRLRYRCGPFYLFTTRQLVPYLDRLRYGEDFWPDPVRYDQA